MIRVEYWRSAILLPICLLSLGAGLGLADQEQTSKGAAENNEIQILRHFLQDVRNFVGSESGSNSHEELESGKEFFSHATGEMKEVGGPQYLAFVSLTNSEVTYLLNREEKPDSIPSIDRNGNPTSAIDAHEQLVLVTQEDASRIASDFLKVAIGDSELANLCKGTNGIQNRGSHFIYVFSWTECIDEKGNAEYLSRVNVELNPKNGRVISFFRKFSKPSGEYPNSMSAEQLESAVASKKKLSGAEIVKKIPFRYHFDDGSSEDACEIQYRPRAAETQKLSSMVVSLRDYRDLTGPKTETVDSGVWDASLVCP